MSHVCATRITVLLQIRKDVEGARHEYYFAAIWEAKKMAGSLAGNWKTTIIGF